MSRRVVLFGLDGATYTVLDDLVRRGVMPFLGRFLSDSARANLTSTVPPLTPPAWLSMITGRSPGRHGITNFLQFESESSQYVRVVTSREVLCPTLFSMVSQAGRKAGCLNFIAHNPAPKLNGYVVPGWVTWRWLRKYSHPEGFLDRLQEQLPGFDVKELGMDFREERKAIQGAELQDYLPWVELHIRRERQWFNILRKQMIENPCDVEAVVFDGVDKLQHLCWPHLDPALEPESPSEDFLQVRQRCWDYFRQIDGFLEETVKLGGPDAHVIVASDHGFTGSDEVLYVNTWLEQQGYLSWAPGAEMQSDESNELGRARPYHLTYFDLPKTKAFAVLASTNGICIQVKGDKGPDGIERCEYDSFRAELIEALLTRCGDPQTGEPLVTGVWTREEAFDGPAMKLAPDLTIALRDCGFFSVLRGQGILKKRNVVMGTHHPDGVLAIHGPGVRRGAKVDSLRLQDVTPTALYLLGLAISEDIEGRVATELFSDEFVKVHAVVRGRATDALPIPAQAIEEGAYAGPGDEEQILMRLKALGYME